MEAIEKEIKTQNNEIIELSPVSIRCPVCGKNKKLKFPNSVINEAKQLTTISIPRGLVCKHHFQAFIDKNFVVRGYQKVDFEYNRDFFKSRRSNRKKNGFYEYIVIEENYCAYKPKEDQIIIERKYDKETANKELNRNLKDIYDEFWDFISENNQKFQKFIKKDPRRKNLTSP